MKEYISIIVCLVISFNSFSQKEISESYTGFNKIIETKAKAHKKIRLKAYIKTELNSDNSLASLWFRDVDANNEILTFKDMGDNVIRETNWKEYTLELDINENSNKLFFGAAVLGFGKFYFRDIRLESLDTNGVWKEIDRSLFDKEINNNNISPWKEGLSEKDFRSLYYTFSTIASGTTSINGKGKTMLISGALPKVDLYPDIVVNSEKFNSNNEPILITNINIINVADGSISKKDVLITDTKIKNISKTIKREADYKIINGNGKWLIPGLIDSHIHLFQSGGLYTRPDALNLEEFKSYNKERTWLKRYASDILKRYLRCGITTVIDVGGPVYNFEIRDKYSDITSFPNVFLTGPLISTYQPKAFEIESAPIIKANTPEEAKNLVKEQLVYKPDFIKIWYINTSEKDKEKNFQIVKATIEEAHLNNLKVAVHATQLETAKLAIKAGAGFLVHSVEDKEIDDEFIDLVRTNNVAYIPTLVVSGNYMETFAQKMSPTTEDFNLSNPIPLGSLYDSKRIEIKPIFKRYISLAKNREASLKKDEAIEANNLKKAILNDFIVATGTDAGNIGTLHATSYYDEIDSMRKAGLTNLNILKASTINAAKVLDKDYLIGSIEEEKMADVVILNANPLETLEALKDIEYVIKGGSGYLVDNIIKDSPEMLVQRQLNGYNARNIDAFLEPYSEDFEVYNYPENLRDKGKSKLRNGYVELFGKYPDLHCELVNRMVLGNKVIDYERITGFSDLPHEVIAIYEINDNKITKVTFLRK